MRLLLRGQDIGWATIGLARVKDQTSSWRRIAIRPEAILLTIQAELKKAGKSFADLTSIAVVTGPGSATALRTSLTVVNTLAFVHGLAVVGLKAKPAAADDQVMQALAIKPARTGRVLVPDYGRAPTITSARPVKVAKSR